MSAATVPAYEYWGYLIKPDKNATPVFEQLLLGVANYINHHIAPWDTQCLTPAKLATFYRLVGGDYDPLFLDTPSSSLSFIYTSLGCFHTLQPDENPYTAPTIPALTPQGFVRWQTVQLLLGPEEHVPFLQEAVKRFELLNPSDGVPFPSILPKEAFPTQADPELSEWHDSVTQKLMLEAQASAARDLPPRPQMALSDIDIESSRDSSVDSRYVGGTASAAQYMYPHIPSRYPIPPASKVPHPPPPYLFEAPWSPERRRSSLPDNSRGFPASWPRNGPQSTAVPQSARKFRPQRHVRGDSDVSTISTSTSDSSSITTSSASLSPVRYHTRLQPPASPAERRHSMNVPPQRPASHPQGYVFQGSHSGRPSRQKSVSWQDKDDVFEYSPDSAKRDRRSSGDAERGYDYGYGRYEERGRGRAVRNTHSNGVISGRRHDLWR
ncbi:hypothetical protein ACLMJK_008397 [Lecanora helva]